MPRPGTPVIPPSALALHRQVSSSAEAMPYTVTIRDPDRQGAYNPSQATHQIDPGAVAYTGLRVRLFPVQLNEDRVEIADQPEQTSRWYLRLPLGTTVTVNQRVTVDTADGDHADQTLVGRVFRVLDHTPRTFATDLRVTVAEEPVPRST